MSEQDNTQEMDLSELLGLDDKEVETAKRRLPGAAKARAALVLGLIFAGAALGKPELAHAPWIDALVSGYVVAAPAALVWWNHRQHNQIKEVKAAAETST